MKQTTPTKKTDEFASENEKYTRIDREYVIRFEASVCRRSKSRIDIRIWRIIEWLGDSYLKG